MLCADWPCTEAKSELIQRPQVTNTLQHPPGCHAAQPVYLVMKHELLQLMHDTSCLQLFQHARIGMSMLLQLPEVVRTLPPTTCSSTFELCFLLSAAT